MRCVSIIRFALSIRVIPHVDMLMEKYHRLWSSAPTEQLVTSSLLPRTDTLLIPRWAWGLKTVCDKIMPLGTLTIETYPSSEPATTEAACPERTSGVIP